MPSERKKLLLRLDPGVHDALARWAGDELRSTNAQIEFLLRRALGDAGRLPGNLERIRRPGRPPASDHIESAAADHTEPGASDHPDRTTSANHEES